MRRWEHDVSAEWLKERRAVLTATEVAGLLPEYKRYLKGKDPDVLMPGFAALWATKHSETELDTSSPSSAAARGHIMEPWAVMSWNAQRSEKFHHWDDCVICNGKLGFSPDAMDVDQAISDARLDVSSDGISLVGKKAALKGPKRIMEIKSYEPAKHMKSILVDRMGHEELMQLAMAFAVLPKLEEAYLLWFCPGAPISMHVEKYTADDLHDQIRWIVEIAELYLDQESKCEKLAHDLEAKCTEEQVWKAYIAEKAASDTNGIFMLRR